MLKRKHRLHARSKLVNPAILQLPMFTLRIARNNLLYNRYGFVVSKKVDKRAVARNRVRRVAVTHVQELEGKFKKGYDVLFRFRKLAVEQESQIGQEIEKALRKEKLL